MNSRAQIRLLPDGRRLHLQDGPIDLIVEAFGAPGEVENAYRAACARLNASSTRIACSAIAPRRRMSPSRTR